MLLVALPAFSCGPSEPVPRSPDAARPPASPATAAAAAAASAPASAASASSDPVSSPDPQETLDPRFVPVMAAAFAEYKPWGRWDDEMRWAPWLCRMPLPAAARVSAAGDGGHARKLYSVFAKHRAFYGYQAAVAGRAQPAGQVIIKEAYHPEPVEKRELDPSILQDQDLDGQGDHFDRYASEDGRLYRASELAGVYVMAKLPPGAEGTDSGWVYGTVTPSGQVTSAGRVASCMGCHVDAGPERLFGAAARSHRHGALNVTRNAW